MWERRLRDALLPFSCVQPAASTVGRKGRRKEEKEGGRKGGRETGREGGRKGGREREREGEESIVKLHVAAWILPY